MFLVIVKGPWTSFLAMEHMVGFLIRLLTYFFPTFMFVTISLFQTIGMLGEPSRLSLTMDNLVDLGETILRDNIGHDGATLQGFCIGSQVLLIGTLEIAPIKMNLDSSFKVDASSVNLGSMSKSSLVQTTICDNEKSHLPYAKRQKWFNYEMYSQTCIEIIVVN